MVKGGIKRVVRRDKSYGSIHGISMARDEFMGVLAEWADQNPGDDTFDLLPERIKWSRTEVTYYRRAKLVHGHGEIVVDFECTWTNADHL